MKTTTDTKSTTEESIFESNSVMSSNDSSMKSSPESGEISGDHSSDISTEYRKALLPRIDGIIKGAVEFARTSAKDIETQSLLDDTIISMREAGLSHRQIALELGPDISEEEVISRLSHMYGKMEEVTTAEYRMLQVGRLEQVINMCWGLAKNGSPDHIELLIKAIERLNKMFELEQERSKVEVEIVTNAQAVMFMSIVSGVLELLLSDERITKVIPAEEIQSITAKALDIAEAEIVDEDGNVRTIGD